ncbi:arginase family protein [Rossellomorea marisflavi]|uniref:arginase family protein n=1 Tax=Rossellomorea marisflavi TaxID=189381 RepID=UPI00207A69EE|nr:arginase family protein [Rossellomorea marisflavi]USK92883.1 arginase family protein [Rossellomorea marisflavi]
MKELYKIKDSLVLFDEQSSLTLWDPKEGWELKLEAHMIDFLKAFAIPATKEAAYRSIATSYNVNEQFFEDIVASFLSQKLIEPVSGAGKTNKPNLQIGMFRTPLISLKECLMGEGTNIAFLGMPYDLNVTYRPGARFAPSYLRKVSGSVFQYDSDTLKGAYDPVKGKQILQNIRMTDIGDISSVVFSRNGTQFDSLEETIYRLTKKNILPTTIGGDHSITLPCVKGAARTYHKIGIIQLDAHSDFGLNQVEDWRETTHHGNFMDLLIEDERVVDIVQIGIRQLVEGYLPHAKVKQYPGKSILLLLSELEDRLNREIPYYLTIDVDAMDPTVLSATGTPLPGGFTYEEMNEVLKTITKSARIIGLDMVELLPGDSEVDGVLASGLLINLLSNVMERLDEHCTSYSKSLT